MPSFLGRLLGLSFTTELLIMNLLGLVNSTFDWRPLKWTNELSQIWNLSLSKESFVVHTIGEDTIKTVLAWIVITRIVSAHVYTFTYVTNIYPIVTWKRPSLLLPWLILSLFKNVVLEVIVIVIGLLLWYEQKFSLLLFLEFIVVKCVPLFLAAYSWYSNSCLYFRLRYMEKTRKLRRSMRSDSNLISSRLYAKIEDSKYRTRSLTTLLSCESYETYDTQDTISRIIDDPNMSPAEKTMKILGITQHDIADARVRARDRAMRRRLTEEEDRIFNKVIRADTTRYFSLSSDYERDMYPTIDNRRQGFNIPSIITWKNQDQTIQSNQAQLPLQEVPIQEAETIEGPPKDIDLPMERRLPRKKREGTEHIEEKRTKQLKLCSSCRMEDLKTYNSHRRREPKHCCSKPRRSVEKSCSPVKLQALFNCNCVYTEDPLKETEMDMEELCYLPNNVTLRTSTPTKDSCDENSNKENIGNLENFDDTFDQSFSFTYDLINAEENLQTMNDSLPLAEKLLMNNVDMLKVVRQDRNVENSSIMEEDVQDVQSVQEEGRNDTFENFNVLVDEKSLSEIVKKLDVIRTGKMEDGMLKSVEKEESGVDEDVGKSVDVSESSNNGENSTQKNNSSPLADETEQNPKKMNFPEFSFGDTNIPRFYQDSMKVFDGCYEKDFDNNVELQCLLQQMEKKKWNLFAGQTSIETLLATAFPKQEEEIDRSNRSEVENSTATGLSINNFEKIGKYGDQAPSITAIEEEILISQNADKSDQLQQSIPIRTIPIEQPTSLDQMKHVYTQTNDDSLQSSDLSLSDAKKRRKPFLKRKRLKDQSRSVSPMSVSNAHVTKPQSKSSVSRDRSKSTAPSRQKAIRPDQPKKQPSMTKSSSHQSLCECKMKKMDAKGSSSSDSRVGEPEGAKNKEKPKLESFGTVPLAQVARTDYSSGIETMVFRRKPPVYPKKTKNEATTQVNSLKKPVAIKKQEIDASKRPSEKKDLKKMKKSRVESLEEKEAREMRALKMYNEVTLMKDRKELESKKKLPSVRNVHEETKKKSSSDKDFDEETKNRVHSRKNNLDRLKRDAEVLYDDYYVDKENLFAEETTETDSSIASSSRNIRVPFNVQSFSVSTEKYTCSNLLKINKVTDRLLDNFDRLHGGQVKQELKKGRTVDLNSRKQYTKYSKPKKVVDEENLSVTSSKKIEGVQKGRELERTPAKEDVRDQTLISRLSMINQLSSVESGRGRANVVGVIHEDNAAEIASTFAEAKKPETKEDRVVKTIKSSVDGEVASSRSSSTVDDADRIQMPLDESKAAEEVVTSSTIVKAEENIHSPPETEERTLKTFKREATISTDLKNESSVEENAEIHLQTEENILKTPRRATADSTNGAGIEDVQIYSETKAKILRTPSTPTVDLIDLTMEIDVEENNQIRLETEEEILRTPRKTPVDLARSTDAEEKAHVFSKTEEAISKIPKKSSVDFFRSVYGGETPHIPLNIEEMTLKTSATGTVDPTKVTDIVGNTQIFSRMEETTPWIPRRTILEFFTAVAAEETPEISLKVEEKALRTPRRSAADTIKGNDDEEKTEISPKFEETTPKTRRRSIIEFFTGVAAEETPKIPLKMEEESLKTPRRSPVDSTKDNDDEENTGISTKTEETTPKTRRRSIIEFFTGVAAEETPEIPLKMEEESLKTPRRSPAHSTKGNDDEENTEISLKFEETTLKTRRRSMVEFFTGAAAEETPEIPLKMEEESLKTPRRSPANSTKGNDDEENTEISLKFEETTLKARKRSMVEFFIGAAAEDTPEIPLKMEEESLKTPRISPVDSTKGNDDEENTEISSKFEETTLKTPRISPVDSTKDNDDKKNTEISSKFEETTLKPPGRPSVDLSRSINAEEALQISPEVRETPRRSPRDTVDFTRNINISCLPHGVVLTNTNAQGGKTQRDIVDDRTARLIHNAFSYGSMDSILDLHSENLSVDDYIADVQLHTPENEFICQASNEFTESSHPEEDCDVCIIAIDHEEPQTNSESEPEDSWHDLEEPEVEILSFNIRGFNLDNIFNVKFEILRSLSNNDEADSSQNQILEVNAGEDDEEHYEEAGEGWIEYEKLLQFVKDDVFTNIEFPVVVRLSDVLPRVFSYRHDDPEVFNTLFVITDNVESIGGCSRRIVEAEDEEMEDDDEELEEMKKQSLQEIEQCMATIMFEASRRLSSGSYTDYSLEDTLTNEKSADLQAESQISKEDTSGPILEDVKLKPVEFGLQPSRPIGSCLNKTFDVLNSNYVDEEKKGYTVEDLKTEETMEAQKINEEVDEEVNVRSEENVKLEKEVCQLEETTVEEDLEEDVFDDSFKTEEIEHIIHEITDVTIESEDIYRHLEFSDFEDEENIFDSETEEEICISSQELEGKQMTSINSEEPNEISESKEEISLKIIVIFWFIVFYFYIRHFYQKICSFAQISRSTSTRKLFEIHTLSTSTSTLLEKTKLVEKIQKENCLQEEEIEDDANSGDLEEIEIPSSIRDVSRNDLSFPSDNKLSQTFEIEKKNSFEEVEKEVEETLLNLTEMLTQNFEIPSVLKLEGLINDNDRSDVDLKEEEEEEEIFFDSDGGDEEIQPHYQNENETSESYSNPFRTLNVSTIGRSSAFVPEGRESIELNPVEEEVETFRFKEVEGSSSSISLFQNDQLESENNGTIDIADVKIESEGPGAEENEKNISRRKSNSAIVENKEEIFYKRSEVDRSISKRKTEENVSSTMQQVEMNNSVEENNPVTPRFFECSPREIDSFDSTYTRASESSENAVSSGDLEQSSMEEFSNASNETA